jgi:hypothetical protein
LLFRDFKISSIFWLIFNFQIFSFILTFVGLLQNYSIIFFSNIFSVLKPIINFLSILNSVLFVSSYFIISLFFHVKSTIFNIISSCFYIKMLNENLTSSYISNKIF